MPNQYPLWKYLLILVAVVLGLIYALPNLYGEDPAIQVSATRTTRVDAGSLAQIEQILKQANLPYTSTLLDEHGAKVRFRDTDTQLRAKDRVQKELGNQYTVALNALLNAKPMYLGLDLRGGVHFLMQVDMQAAIKQAEERYIEDLRRTLQDKKVRYLTVSRRDAGGLEIKFRDEATRSQARDVIRQELPELVLTDSQQKGEYTLVARLSEPALREKRKFALEQNITALRKRVDELAVAEPVIQQQGDDRIVVQLPGVQDTARAKEILGRTATLEIMMVDEEHNVLDALSGRIPPGSKLYHDRRGAPILLKKPLI